MRPGLTLARTIRYLTVLQSAQGEGLTAEQAKKLLPLLQSLPKLDPLPPTEAENRLNAIMQSLTDAQKRLLQSLGPLWPPSNGARATPPTPRTRPNVPIAAGLAQAGGGGASDVDPARPFASERNRAALEELIGMLVKVSR